MFICFKGPASRLNYFEIIQPSSVDIDQAFDKMPGFQVTDMLTGKNPDYGACDQKRHMNMVNSVLVLKESRAGHERPQEVSKNSIF